MNDPESFMKDNVVCEGAYAEELYATAAVSGQLQAVTKPMFLQCAA